jgi:hypothetical protein
VLECHRVQVGGADATIGLRILKESFALDARPCEGPDNCCQEESRGADEAPEPSDYL